MLLPPSSSTSVAISMRSYEKIRRILSFLGYAVKRLLKAEVVKLNEIDSMSLRMHEQASLLRILQLGRIAEADYSKPSCTSRRSCIVVRRGALFGTVEHIANSISEPHLMGAAIIWLISLRNGLASNAIIDHATTQARPRSQAISPPLENPTIYDKLVLEMYEQVVMEWPKTVGYSIARAKYISVYKPLNDAALMLSLAAVSGLIMLRDTPGATIAEYTTRDNMSPYRLRKLRDLLDGYIPYHEAISSNTLPAWQELVLKQLSSAR
ncbi:MAG TPA: hypothetical protein EYP33_04140 [Pyrodictium sp.]|nr:hypothetical protein [Pyrodictium sp.]